MLASNSYTSNLALLTLAVSLSGVLSLSLADTLPWTIFTMIAFLHVIVYRRFYEKDFLPPRLLGGVVLIIFCIEIARILIYGKETIFLSLRDLIVILACSRLLLKKGPRQIYQIIGISLAEIIFATILTISPLFLAEFCVMVFIIPAALYALDSLNYHSEQGLPKALHWIIIGISIITVSGLLFYVIPRPYETLIDLHLSRQKKTGFTEEINLEGSYSIAEDISIVMRVVWEKGNPPKSFYLSGARLDKISSHGFTKGAYPSRDFIQGFKQKDKLTIYPADIGVKNIFFPFRLTDISPNHVTIEGLNHYWKDSAPPAYDIWVNRSTEKNISEIMPLPEELITLGAFGKSVAGHGNNKQKAKNISEYLKVTCTYTTETIHVPKNASPVPWFVFNGKRGSCEHFASALGIMLLGAGVPARLVTGFYVHEYNPRGEYYIIRARDAHAWVEYWNDEPSAGWNSIDPTPYVSEQYKSKQNIFDTFRFQWIRWVIHYSLQDQISIAGQVRMNAPDVIKNVTSFIPVFGAILLILYGCHLLIQRRRSPVYHQVLKAFAKKGIHLDKNIPHENHITYIEKAWPSMAIHFRDYLENYLSWRFGKHATDIISKTKEFINRIKTTPRV